MIIRIVVMTFTEHGVASFLSLFLANQKIILASEGCSQLILMKNTVKPHSYATWSHWETPMHLEAYRNSPLFINLWKQLKPLFAATPVAHSLEAISGIG